MSREVRESDFRMPKFRDAKPIDYEFRWDGTIVKKSRWEDGIRSIVSALGWTCSEFEVIDVVDAVASLIKDPVEDLENLIEQAFLDFDTESKSTGESRDAFKRQARLLLTAFSNKEESNE